MATRQRDRPDASSAPPSSPSPGTDETPTPGQRLSDVDEWGRSEHTRAIARRLFAPLYDNWFRVEWEGLEKIPKTGGALLVANHAGAIPSDAPVIMHGIEVELGRPVYGMADFFFREAALDRDGVGPRRRCARPSRQRPAAAARPGPAGARLPRGDQGPVEDLHRPLPAAALRARRASSRSPCEPASR